MNYPFKYCLIVHYDDNYSGGVSHLYYCDYADAENDYNYYTDEEDRKCILYRLLKHDNFNL